MIDVEVICAGRKHHCQSSKLGFKEHVAEPNGFWDSPNRVKNLWLSKQIYKIGFEDVLECEVYGLSHSVLFLNESELLLKDNLPFVLSVIH